MKDTSKTKGELIAELKALRRDLHQHMDAESDAAKAEEAMWQTQIALLALFNNLPGMAYRTAFTDEHPDGRVEFVSGGCVRLTGYPASRYVSGPTFYREKVLHPDDRDWVKREMERAQEEHRTYELTYRIVAQDGTIHWLNEHGTGLYDSDGNLIAREGFISDVSDNVQQLQEIRRQHAQLQKLTRAVEQAHELIMIGDATGTVQYVNLAFEKVTGFTREEMVGKLPSVAVPDLGKTAFFKQVLRQLKSGKVWQGRYVSTKKDGTLFEVEATVSPIFSSDGTFDGYVAQQRNTTDEIRSTPEDRNAQRLEVLGLVAGSFIRDLNNQLQAVIGYGQRAADSEHLDTASQEHLRTALDAADHASKITSEFLDFLRQDHAEPTAVSFTETCEKTVRLLRASLPASIAVGGQLSDGDLVVLGNPCELTQAIVALGVAAARGIGRGRGTLNLRLEHLEPGSEAASDIAAADGTALCRVITTRVSEDEDSGDEAPLPAGTASDTSPFALPVIRDVIQEHGGRLRVGKHMAAGVLNEFVVLLPLIRKSAARDEGTSRSGNTTAQTAGASIMFVDDEKLLAELAKLELEDLGYTVHPFTSAREALAAFERDSRAFDLVIADQTMPEMTGFDLAQHMLEKRPKLPIILITGYSDLVNDLQARAIGIRDYLIKPITPETLAESVANALGSA